MPTRDSIVEVVGFCKLQSLLRVENTDLKGKGMAVVDQQRVVTGNTKPLVPLFTKASDCIYTSCYCEENVWKLCQEVATKHGSELQHCHIAFISNPSRSVPLWRQRAGKDEDKLVVWDYHAILIYAPDERAVVYDLDSSLPFPTHFWKYATETFRSDEALRPEYHRRFRLVPAATYLQHFASNRHHMKREDGTWIKTPPDYPPISTPTCKDNLDSFINMDQGTGFGVVMSLKQLVNRFYRPNVNAATPAPPQPQTHSS